MRERLILSTTPFLTGPIRLYEQAGFVRIARDHEPLFGTPLFGMSKILGRVELRATHARHPPFVLPRRRHRTRRRSSFSGTARRHAAALADPDLAHYVVRARPDLATVGFALLAGLRRDDRVIEPPRIVITMPGREGFGRAAIQAVKRLVFDSLGGERLWLDVKPDNARARALYASEGFREDGTPGADALIIMSLLRDANWP